MCLACPRHKIALGTDRLATPSCGVASGRWSAFGCRALPTRLKMRTDNTYEEAVKLLQRNQNALPGLVVLDLDYTIWPFWCEIYRPRETHAAQLFPESRAVIEACKDQGVRMAVASRSPTPATADAFLKKLGLAEGYFEEILVIPYTQKDQTHFPQLRKKLGVEYSDMLFFDDESGNISRCSRLGVTSILVSTSDGVCIESFKKGLDTYARQAGRRG